jgi:hypothetical protein
MVSFRGPGVDINGCWNSQLNLYSIYTEKEVGVRTVHCKHRLSAEDQTVDVCSIVEQLKLLNEENTPALSLKKKE